MSLKVLSLIFVFVSAQAYAQLGARPDYEDPNAAVEESEDAEAGDEAAGESGTTTNSNGTGFEGTNDEGIHNSANRGQSSQNTGAMINGVVGAGLMAACAACAAGSCSCCSWACPMGAMALMQAATTAGAAGESGNVAGLSDFGNFSGFDNFDPNNPAGGADGASSPRLSIPGERGELTELDIGAELQTAADLGYTVDPDTGMVNTPNGPVPASTFSSAANMQAAGFSADTAAEAQKKAQGLAARARDRFRVSGMKVAGGGGGGGGSYKPSKFDYKSPFASLMKKKKGRAPSSVAGLKRMIGNDPVGVKADDIFKMVHRRYQRKRKKSTFVENASGRVM